MKFTKTLSFLAVTLGVAIVATEAQPAQAKATSHAVPKTLQGTWFGKYHDDLFGNVPVKYRLTKYSFLQAHRRSLSNKMPELIMRTSKSTVQLRIKVISSQLPTRLTSMATGN